MTDNKTNNKTVFITGGAKRIGACVINHFHTHGYNIVLHYRHSKAEAIQLANTLNSIRADSVKTITGDLQHVDAITDLAHQALTQWNRVDVLINNASSFYPTPIGTATRNDWDTLLGPNLMAPFFLAQALQQALKETQGSIINMTDIYADRPLQEHSLYCAAKAGLVSLTKSMAQELGPDVRVNAVAPGPIMWPSDNEQDNKEAILQSTALKRLGGPQQIAETIYFLVNGSDYITGQVIAVDGGRTLQNP